MRQRFRSSAGFTVLELLVVLAVFTLVLGGMMLARPNLADTRVRAVARSVVATLRLARSQAIESNIETLVIIDADEARMGIAGKIRSLPSGFHLALTVAENETSGTRGGLRFYPDGQSSGGEIVLGLNGKSVRVGVSWLTGEARIEP